MRRDRIRSDRTRVNDKKEDETRHDKTVGTNVGELEYIVCPVWAMSERSTFGTNLGQLRKESGSEPCLGEAIFNYGCLQ